MSLRYLVILVIPLGFSSFFFQSSDTSEGRQTQASLGIESKNTSVQMASESEVKKKEEVKWEEKSPKEQSLGR